MIPNKRKNISTGSSLKFVKGELDYSQARLFKEWEKAQIEWEGYGYVFVSNDP
jgi:hypothetical protein